MAKFVWMAALTLVGLVVGLGIYSRDHIVDNLGPNGTLTQAVLIGAASALLQILIFSIVVRTLVNREYKKPRKDLAQLVALEAIIAMDAIHAAHELERSHTENGRQPNRLHEKIRDIVINLQGAFQSQDLLPAVALLGTAISDEEKSALLGFHSNSRQLSRYFRNEYDVRPNRTRGSQQNLDDMKYFYDCLIAVERPEHNVNQLYHDWEPESLREGAEIRRKLREYFEFLNGPSDLQRTIRDNLEKTKLDSVRIKFARADKLREASQFRLGIRAESNFQEPRG